MSKDRSRLKRLAVKWKRRQSKAQSFHQRFRSNPAYLALLLGSFALFTAVLLSSGHMATQDVIVLRQKEDLQSSLELVIPSKLHDNDLVKDAYPIKDANGVETLIYPAYLQGKLQAVAYQTTGLGYGGAILVLLGVDREGALLGVRVLQHAETPGLGDKIEANRSDWIYKFTGLSLQNPLPDLWKVKKDGGYFDQLSGATITPRAVVKSVKLGLEFFTTNRKRLLGETDGAQS